MFQFSSDGSQILSSADLFISLFFLFAYYLNTLSSELLERSSFFFLPRNVKFRFCTFCVIVFRVKSGINFKLLLLTF